MHTPIGTIPRLSIGRHTDQVADLNLIDRTRCPGRPRIDIEVTNVAVRTEDCAAFLATIAAREGHIAEGGDPERSHAGKALEIAQFAQKATEALNTDCPRDLAIANLENTAALAIGLLAELKGKQA